MSSVEQFYDLPSDACLPLSTIHLSPQCTEHTLRTHTQNERATQIYPSASSWLYQDRIKFLLLTGPKT